VGEDKLSYKFTYKDSDCSHINLFNLDMKGKYAIYIIINDIYYDTETIGYFN